jgi:membrane fusion protein (multidrug efflux system)
MAEPNVTAQTAAQAPKSNAGKKIFGLIVLLAIAGGGYYYWTQLQKVESTDDAQIDGHIISVSPRITGHVLEVLVEDEQVVKKGDVLVKLDPKDYEVAVAKAQADLQDAMASLESSRTDVPLTSMTTSSTLTGAKSARQDAAAAVSYAQRNLAVAQARITTAQANVKVAEANALRTEQDVNRYKGLVAKDEISRQQYDQAESTLAAAKATIEAQKAAVIEAQQSVTAAEVAVEQAKAKLAQADSNVEAAMTGPQQISITKSRAEAAAAKVAQQRAALEQAQLNLSYITVTAPADGVIGKTGVNPGQNVEAGQEMMALVPLDDLWITANFKENQLRNLKSGQKVTITVDANGRDYKGHVERIAGASGARMSLLPPENATGNYVKVVQRIPVRISLDPGQNQDHALRPGMSVTPTVDIR